MIVKIPDKIRLPNYDVCLRVTSKPQEEGNGGINFGEFSRSNPSASISNVNPVFNKYLFSTFVIFSLANSYEINVLHNKANILGMYLYHLLTFNDLRKIFSKFQNGKPFKPFQVSVPSFKIKVESCDDESLAYGLIIISKRHIKIFQGCSARLKRVILLHELLEWVNIMYDVRLKHSEIQSLAEGLTYVISNGKFST